MPSKRDIQGIVMPDELDGCYTLELYSKDGVHLYTLHKTKRRSFEQHLDERASQWKKGDPDMYNKIMFECLLADMQTQDSNNA